MTDRVVAPSRCKERTRALQNGNSQFLPIGQSGGTRELLTAWSGSACELHQEGVAGNLSLGISFASMACMLLIGDDLLPQTDLTYFAFRVAFCDTLERVALAEQARMPADAPQGYLTDVPFLRNVPPRVQLDLLLDTWTRHFGGEKTHGNLLDEAVIYAACETSARLATGDRKSIRRFLRGGPRPLFPVLDDSYSQSLHALHVNLSGEGDFLLISQFQDMPPDEARVMKAKFNLNEMNCEPLFDALGRWRVAPNFCAKSKGLLTSLEATKVANILRLPKPAERASS
jgi:hypothetical protein